MPHTLDFLVRVIDNFGDTGFALELAFAYLQKNPDDRIRFFSDDRKLFDRLIANNSISGLEYCELADFATSTPNSDIYIFFDAKIDMDVLFESKKPHHVRILSYLRFDTKGIASMHGTSYAIDAVKITHLVPSPLSEGAGIVIPPSTSSSVTKSEFNNILGISLDPKKLWITAFVYNPTLPIVLAAAKNHPEIEWLIMGRPDETIDASEKNIHALPFLSFERYSKLLKTADANMVRGENSAMKALFAGKPFLWDFYKESNGAHIPKIDDFTEFSGQSNAIMRAFNTSDFNDQIASIESLIALDSSLVPASVISKNILESL